MAAEDRRCGPLFTFLLASLAIIWTWKSRDIHVDLFLASTEYVTHSAVAVAPLLSADPGTVNLLHFRGKVGFVIEAVGRHDFSKVTMDARLRVVPSHILAPQDMVRDQLATFAVDLLR